MDGARPVRSPRGTTLTARSWQTEAPLRMLQNNLDPDVAERPDDLVVYGGTGRAARDWRSFDAMVRTLTTLADDETMLVQSGRPVGVLQTHEWAPRVLAIEVLTAARALDLRAPLHPAAATGAVRDAVRAAGVPGPGPDRHLAPEIEAVVGLVAAGHVTAATGLTLD